MSSHGSMQPMQRRRRSTESARQGISRLLLFEGCAEGSGRLGLSSKRRWPRVIGKVISCSMSAGPGGRSEGMAEEGWDRHPSAGEEAVGWRLQDTEFRPIRWLLCIQLEAGFSVISPLGWPRSSECGVLRQDLQACCDPCGSSHRGGHLQLPRLLQQHFGGIHARLIYTKHQSIAKE